MTEEEKSVSESKQKLEDKIKENRIIVSVCHIFEGISKATGTLALGMAVINTAMTPFYESLAKSNPDMGENPFAKESIAAYIGLGMFTYAWGSYFGSAAESTHSKLDDLYKQRAVEFRKSKGE